MALLPSILAGLVTRSPVYVVWVIAIVVAIVRWSRHPRVSLIAIVSITGLAVLSTASYALAVWLPLHLTRSGVTMMQVGKIMALDSAVTSLLEAACWAGLLLAIFLGRSPQPRRVTPP